MQLKALLKSPLKPQPGPDRNAAMAQYRQRAGTYDLELALFEPIRRAAIGALALRPGETVFDVGCGTGLSLAALHQGVGSAGRIVGIEQSPEMIALADERVNRARHRNVELICAPAEEARIGERGDAALFHFTHDILRRPEALEHLLPHLKPGARIVASGLQWAQPWALPVNLFVWGAALRSVSSLQGLDRPWNLLADRIDGFKVQDLLFGAVFLGEGTAR